MKKYLVNTINFSLFLTLAVMFSALFGLYWFLTHSFMEVSINPKDALVTINNAPVKVGALGRIKRTLTPGDYNLRVEADGYIAFIQNVTLKRSKKSTIAVALKEIPEPTVLAENAALLAKDKEFNTFYYLGESGKTLYKAISNVDEDGLIQLKTLLPVTEPRLSGIEEIIWSPNKDLALFRKKDTINLFDFKKYDFVNQTETPWGKDISSIAWAPDNSKIAYYYAPGNGEKSLIFANLSNTEITRVANLAEMGLNNPLLRWSPDSEWLLVVPRNSPDYEKNKVYLFNAYSRTFKVITETGSQVDAIFSPDSNQVLYATYSKGSNNPINTVISVMDKDGSNKRALDVRAELRKVVWQKDSKNLIVASYNEAKHQESIFGYNIDTKQKTDFSINALGDGYINNIAISDDNKIVIYEAKGGIYALKIE